MNNKILSLVFAFISLSACAPKDHDQAANSAAADQSAQILSEANLNQNGCRFIHTPEKLRLTCAQSKSLLAKYNQGASVTNYLYQLRNLRQADRKRNANTSLNFTLKELNLMNYQLAHKARWNLVAPISGIMRDGSEDATDVSTEISLEYVWLQTFAKLSSLSSNGVLVVKFARTDASDYPTAERAEILSTAAPTNIEPVLESIEKDLVAYQTSVAESKQSIGDVEAIRAIIRVIRASLSPNGVP